jgi:deazaflavin-dependent oxidoreductase (nitroreductase family)
MAAEFRQTWLRRLGNRLIAPLARLGLAGKRTHVLTVPGRMSGKKYSTPVMLVFHGGERWLVAPYGQRPWVRNARAGGAVQLTRALHTERVPLEEVDAQTAAPVLREYLRKTPITKPFFDASADSSLEEFAAEAHRHPVFRIVRAG